MADARHLTGGEKTLYKKMLEELDATSLLAEMMLQDMTMSNPLQDDASRQLARDKYQVVKQEVLRRMGY